MPSLHHRLGPDTVEGASRRATARPAGHRPRRDDEENHAMASDPAPSSPASLADEVYRQLREDILSGRLRPRDHLVEVDLADRLNVSRTPIRESLQRLAADGLIVSHRRRWVVYEHTLGEIADIYEVRMALEGYAARLACQRATDEQVASLRDYFDARAHRYTRYAAFADFNTQFHQLITQAANNPYFQRLADANRFYTFNHQVAQRYGDADVAESDAQHAQIVRTIVERDPDGAEHAARGHVQLALQVILERHP
jgi:DNA-binding GntR family transcriptional regulator